MNIIEIYESTGKHLTYKSNGSSGPEYYGAYCPVCKTEGNDRFIVWPEHPKDSTGRYYCRTCGKAGSGSWLAKEIAGTSQMSGKVWGLLQRYSLPTPGILPEPKPAATTTARSSTSNRTPTVLPDSLCDLVNDCALRLKTNVQPYLQWRGISSEPAKKALLGYNHKLREVSVGEKKYWLPVGIVIPTIRDNKLYAISIRRLGDNDKSYGKYSNVGTPIPYSPVPINDPSKPLFITESQLDAVLLRSNLGVKANCVALCSITTKPDTWLDTLIKSAPQVYFCADYDEQGIAGAKKWQTWYPTIKVVTMPNGKDPTEAWQHGVNLKEWGYSVLGIEGCSYQITREIQPEYVEADTAGTQVMALIEQANAAYAANDKAGYLYLVSDKEHDAWALSNGTETVIGSGPLPASAIKSPVVLYAPYQELALHPELTGHSIGSPYFHSLMLGSQARETLREMSSRILGYAGGEPSLLNTRPLPWQRVLAGDTQALVELTSAVTKIPRARHCRQMIFIQRQIHLICTATKKEVAFLA